MDPATLLPTINETIKATYEISKIIDSLFTSEIAPADLEDVVAFPHELDSARNAIIGIQSCLESTVFARDGQADSGELLQQFLSSISATLHDFQEWLANVRAVFAEVYASPNGNFIQRDAKELQKKFNLKGSEVATILAQLTAYKQTFQLALSTITV